MQEDEKDDLSLEITPTWQAVLGLLANNEGQIFTNPFRQQAAEVAATGLCQPPPLGCGLVATAFRDEISVREYNITGMCQNCQDQVYALAEEWEEQGMQDYDDEPIEYDDASDERDFDDAGEPAEWNEREMNRHADQVTALNRTIPLEELDPWGNTPTWPLLIDDYGDEPPF